MTDPKTNDLVASVRTSLTDPNANSLVAEVHQHRPSTAADAGGTPEPNPRAGELAAADNGQRGCQLAVDPVVVAAERATLPST